MRCVAHALAYRGRIERKVESEATGTYHEGGVAQAYMSSAYSVDQRGVVQEFTEDSQQARADMAIPAEVSSVYVPIDATDRKAPRLSSIHTAQ